jgi:hypothetical protein
LVKVGEPCIAIAGSGRGADTAVVLVPAHAQDFFDLHVMEVLAKPHLGDFERSSKKRVKEVTSQPH